MASLVLLALLAFVVAPAIEQASQAFRGAQGDDAVVVKWNGGKITVGDLYSHSQKHGNLVRFLRSLAEAVVEAGGQPQVPGFMLDPQSGEIISLGVQANNSDLDLCRTRILNSYAQRQGITFSDDAIDSFIRFYCDKRITDQQLATILDESTGGRLSAFDLRELLKQELVAMIVGQTARSGIYAQAPGKTYRDFKRLNQTATIEAFPFLVDDFLDKVSGAPSDPDIQAIYEAGMTRPADPRSPDPGFLRQYQANIQYVEADLQAWNEREKAKLTEEQLRAEYDRRVELGQMQVPVIDEATSATESESDSADAEGSSDSDAAEAPASVEGATTTGETAPSTSDEQPSSEQPSKDLQLSEPPGDGATETPADQSAIQSDQVKFVSFLQDAASETPPPVVQPPQLGADELRGSLDAAAAPAMRTQTFEEARDEIAESLAQESAGPAMREAFNDLRDNHMKPYFAAYRQYRAFRDSEELKDAQEAKQPPAKPDLKKLAEERGLKYVDTGMLDGYKLAQTPFGQSNISATGQSASVANAIMTPQLELFRPLESNYFDQAALSEGRFVFLQYVFWKSEEKQAYIPELSEVKEEVIAAWKQTQARKLASDEARQLADRVSSSEKGWEAALSPTEQLMVLQPDPPFTWITRFGEFINISPVDKLDPVGHEFMQSVFSASPGKIVVAPNQPQTKFFVIRVDGFAPDEETLRERFNADPQKSGPLGVARQEVDDMIIDWYQNLERELGVEWQMSTQEFN